MRLFLALFSLIAALTLPGLGVADAWASPVEPAPCHADRNGAPSSQGDDGSAPAHSPAKAMKMMACCIACVAAPLPTPTARPGAVARPSVAPRLQAAVLGRTVAPEPDPPKV